ncbi:MAG: hypothetical protein JWN63_267 [Candidatus Acidoferrum typicum]|nr:hypothetical protein [Candidatus Acidoferrum typicum]
MHTEAFSSAPSLVIRSDLLTRNPEWKETTNSSVKPLTKYSTDTPTKSASKKSHHQRLIQALQSQAPP